MVEHSTIQNVGLFCHSNRSLLTLETLSIIEDNTIQNSITYPLLSGSEVAHDAVHAL
jgi:hypothetical protein